MLARTMSSCGGWVGAYSRLSSHQGTPYRISSASSGGGVGAPLSAYLLYPPLTCRQDDEIRGERGAASQVVRGPMTVVIKRLTSVVAPLAFHAMGAVGRTFW